MSVKPSPSPGFHLSAEEFRRHGHDAIEWIARYMENVESFPVLSQVKPGQIRSQLPDSPPQTPERMEDILTDLDRIILPGVTHWQSPGFFAFFPCNNSPPSILGELLSAALGVQGMLWATSPACTELETHVLDWVAKMLELPEKFLSQGKEVTVYDNMCQGRPHWVESQKGKPGFRFVKADLVDLEPLVEAMKGHDMIWHLGANADIPRGIKETDLDLKNGTIATWNVLEAMKRLNIKHLVYTSSSTVFGDPPHIPTREGDGPLLPISLYGASKLTGEAYISAYCHLFGLQAWIFRFGKFESRLPLSKTQAGTYTESGTRYEYRIDEVNYDWRFREGYLGGSFRSVSNSTHWERITFSRY